MNAQEILQGITGNRADRLKVNQPSNTVITTDLVRKLDEIEWALQALAEHAVEVDQRVAQIYAILASPTNAANQAIIDDMRRQFDAKKT